MNSFARQGRLAGTAETWRVVRAWAYGEDVKVDGERIRVPSGVMVRGFLIIMRL